MGFPRLRFSLRTLLIACAVLGAALGFALRFGSHLLWKTVYSGRSSGVAAIPSQSLVDHAALEDIVACRIGPISFELPASMSERFEVQRGVGGVFIVFYDANRSLGVELPRPDDRGLQQLFAEFPAQAELSFPRLHLEILSAKSSDFSFGMSHRELRLHQKLLSARATISISIEAIEYVRRPELDGNLLRMRSADTFQWSTADGKWRGDLYFKGDRGNGWVRHVCATFQVQGDAALLRDLDEAKIKEMIRITKVE